MSDSDSEDITPSQPADDDANLPALFWENMPDNAEEHPDYIALKALEEESTPEERAENFKVSLEHLYCRQALAKVAASAAAAAATASAAAAAPYVQHRFEWNRKP
jgi:hypothetical protein